MLFIRVLFQLPSLLVLLLIVTIAQAGESSKKIIVDKTECNDGLDNDGDGYIDYAFDLGCYGPSDISEHSSDRSTENGWTTFDKPPSTLIYYISTDGNDENTGLSPLDPFATFEQARKLLLRKKRGWVLFKRGDIFDFLVDLTNIHGESKANPILISSYGHSLERPIFNNKISAIKSSSNIYIIGLHTKVTKPSASNSHFSGVRFVGSHMNISLEDNRVDYGQVIFQRYGDDAVLKNISIRRNIISRAYSMDSHAQGLFVSGADNLLINQNFFDHNGWLVQSSSHGREHDRAQATIFNHNMYINGSSNIAIHDNLIFRASSMGIKMRSDKQGLSQNISIKRNIFYEGEIGVGIGGNTSEKFRFVNAAVEGNVFLSLGSGKPTNRNISWPIAAKDIRGLKVSNNIIAHQEQHKGSYALKMTKSIEDAVIKNNIVYGVDEVGFILNNDNWRNISFEDNIIHDSKHSQSKAIITSGSLEGLEFINNKTFLWRKNDNWLESLFLSIKRLTTHRDYFSEYTDQGLEFVEAMGFRAPNRDLQSYFEQFNNSIEDKDIMDSIIKNRSRFLWNEKYTAESISKYISDGFELNSQE